MPGSGPAAAGTVAVQRAAPFPGPPAPAHQVVALLSASGRGARFRGGRPSRNGPRSRRSAESGVRGAAGRRRCDRPWHRRRGPCARAADPAGRLGQDGRRAAVTSLALPGVSRRMVMRTRGRMGVRGRVDLGHPAAVRRANGPRRRPLPRPAPSDARPQVPSMAAPSPHLPALAGQPASPSSDHAGAICRSGCGQSCAAHTRRGHSRRRPPEVSTCRRPETICRSALRADPGYERGKRRPSLVREPEQVGRRRRRRRP